MKTYMYSYRLLVVVGLCWLLQLGSSNIDCRTSCRRCRENLEDPELLEVYCAMCDECKERRREWVQGGPNIRLRKDEQDESEQYDHQEQQETRSTQGKLSTTCCYSIFRKNKLHDRSILSRIYTTLPTEMLKFVIVSNLLSTKKRGCRSKQGVK